MHDKLLGLIAATVQRMEITMAVNFDALNASISDLQGKVDLLKGVPAGGPAVDEAAIQAQIDAANARVQSAMAEMNAELSRLLNAPVV